MRMGIRVWSLVVDQAKNISTEEPCGAKNSDSHKLVSDFRNSPLGIGRGDSHLGDAYGIVVRRAHVADNERRPRRKVTANSRGRDLASALMSVLGKHAREKLHVSNLPSNSSCQTCVTKSWNP